MSFDNARYIVGALAPLIPALPLLTCNAAVYLSPSLPFWYQRLGCVSLSFRAPLS